ncbi:hypothetical protein KKA14_03370 [bacterium]|nr:hypothetical protein [bacterium]
MTIRLFQTSGEMIAGFLPYHTLSVRHHRSAPDKRRSPFPLPVCFDKVVFPYCLSTAPVGWIERLTDFHHQYYRIVSEGDGDENAVFKKKLFLGKEYEI